MATKIRLQRHGRKGYPVYKIVIADSRAPRDGKFIERLGSYNPNTNPATIDLDFDRALYWISVGAQPTDTTRNILSREGVLYKKHLLGGVKKGAFDQAEADRRFNAWLEEKEGKLIGVRNKENQALADIERQRLAAEKEVNEAKAKLLADKKAAEAKAKADEAAARAAEAAAAEAPEEAAAPAEETPEEASTPEETAAE